MPNYNEAVLDEIQKILTRGDWQRFKEILARDTVLGADIAEDRIWQAFYEADAIDFYHAVLPPRNQTIFSLALKAKGNNKNVYKAADKIIAASSVFKDEAPNLKNMAKAWDVVAQAQDLARDAAKQYLAVNGHSIEDAEYKRLQAITKHYEHGAKKTFDNILRTRPENFQFFGTLYNDQNYARRNKRIKKYLFQQPNAKIITRLIKKVEKLETEIKAQVNKDIAAQKAEIIQDIHEQTVPKMQGSSFISRNIAKTFNKTVDSAIKGAIKTPGITKQKQEIDELLAEDLVFIRDTDKLFGLKTDQIQFKNFSLPSGTPLDIKNMSVEQMTRGNLIATAKQTAINKVHQNIHSSTEGITDKSMRSVRILIAVVAIITILVSVGLIVAFPPLLPFVITADAALLLAGASFVYFNRDPIPKITEKSEGLFTRVANAFDTIFRPKTKPNPTTFDMPEATKQFLKSLDPQLSGQLESHFKNRATEIKTILQTAIAANDETSISSITHDLNKLDSDWQQIITAANVAAATGDKQQFRDTVQGYLKDSYETIARPKFIEQAKERKQLWDTAKEHRKTLTFSEDKHKIEELKVIAEKLQHIDVGAKNTGLDV